MTTTVTPLDPIERAKILTRNWRKASPDEIRIRCRALVLLEAQYHLPGEVWEQYLQMSSFVSASGGAL